MKKQFFIAILPPEEISEAITELRKEIAARFNSLAALRIEPHITLKAPFYEEEIPAVSWFEKLQLPSKPFTITLDGFDVFSEKKKPVIFVNPVLTTELQVLRDYIINSFKSQFEEQILKDHTGPFKPHITIGYRDLGRKEFLEAWSEFKTRSFKQNFIANSITLMSHNGKSWDRHKQKFL